MGYIEVDSKKIYVEEYGKENTRAIVFFHGGPGASCVGFTNQARALGEKYHVVSFDQYGVLRSDAIPDDEPFGRKDHVELIDKMREALGIKSWTVLGHSYGGTMACQYAHTYPDSTDAVAYECSTWDFKLFLKSVAVFFIPYFQEINSEEGINYCNKIINAHNEDDGDSHGILIHSVLPLVKDPQKRLYLHNISIEEFNRIPDGVEIPENCGGKAQVHCRKLREGGARETFNCNFSSMQEIKKPSLLLVGKYDPVCSQYEREYFRQNAFKGTFVEFENSGHFPHREEPEAYTEAVTNFMDSII